MPYRRPYKKPRYKRRQRVPLNKRVKSIIASTQETKYKDTFFASNSISTTPTNTQLYTLTSGSDEDQRTGFKIRATGVYGRFMFTNGDDTNVVRIILYQTKGNASTLTSTGIYNALDPEQYTIFYDKHVKLQAPFTGGTQNKEVVLRKSFKNKFNSFQGKLITYDTVSSTSSMRPIYMLVVSDSVAISHPTILGNLRAFYKDI